MKHLSYKILISCLLMPSVLYISSLIIIENYMQERYAHEIERIYLGDTHALFNGRLRLEEAIRRNLDHYLQNDWLVAWGVSVNVIVSTQQNTILYPIAFEESAPSLQPIDSALVAAENYRLMNETLVLDVKVELAHGTLISNLVSAFYILLAAIILSLHYRLGLRKIHQEEFKKQSEIARLSDLTQKHSKKLDLLGEERDRLSLKYHKLKKRLEDEKRQSIRNEDGWVKEIVTLEQRLDQNLRRQESQLVEIEQLKQTIHDYQKSQDKAHKQREKIVGSTSKRFDALYKNISINTRAIDGFLDLPESLKIKGEEIIHQLNNDPSKVQIKRKVFGRKNRQTVLEVVFGYKGRLYFRKAKDQHIEVLTIGTKNNQMRDLEFLSGL